MTSSSTIPLPPRLLVAIFRVDIYYERGLGRSNIAFKKLGRTALNHDRIINHDCLNTCRKDRSTGKILLDDFHLCFLGKRLVSLNFLIKLRKLITKGAERRETIRRGGEFAEEMVETYESASGTRFPFTTSVHVALKTMRLQVVTSTGVCACFFYGHGAYFQRGYVALGFETRKGNSGWDRNVRKKEKEKEREKNETLSVNGLDHLCHCIS